MVGLGVRPEELGLVGVPPGGPHEPAGQGHQLLQVPAGGVKYSQKNLKIFKLAQKKPKTIRPKTPKDIKILNQLGHI